MPPYGVGGIGIGVVVVDGVVVGVTVVVSSVVEIDALVWCDRLPVNYILKRIIIAQLFSTLRSFLFIAVYCDN